MRIVLKWLLPTSLGALVLCVACGGSSTGLVDNAPHFTAQPASQTVYSGANATFTVAANGYPAPTFTWERSNDAGATWTPIAGATSSSYGFTVQSTDTGAVFRAVATNSVASTNSLPATLTKVPAVYAAGMIDVTNPYPGYWINGTWVGLTVPSIPAGGWVSSLAVSVDSSGSKVYLAGTDGYGSPGYWLNGTWVGLPTGYTGPGVGIVSSLVLNGSDIYAAGQIVNSSGLGVIGYWLNGTWVGLPVPSGSKAAPLLSCAAAGSSTYFAGNLFNTSTNLETPGYWLNGTWAGLPLPSGSNAGAATRLVLSGSDVYIAGYTYTLGSSSSLVPGYWSNGIWVGLPVPSGSNAGSVTSLVVSGGEVYAGGYLYTVDGSGNVTSTAPGYWLNGTWVSLPVPSGSNTGTVTSLVVSGGAVYAGGDIYTLDSAGRLSSCIPGYWLDGTWTGLPIPSNSGSANVGTSRVNALVVIP